MDWLGIFAWGLCATAAMTTIESFGPWLGVSRMSTPLLVGTMFVADRDRAMAIGVALHVALGWGFALVYAALFEAAGFATWWLGLLFGLGHALFMLAVVLPVLPAAHPRLATERHGPTPTRALQSPGFLALNYGRNTALVSLLAYGVYGLILGALYRA